MDSRTILPQILIPLCERHYQGNKERASLYNAETMTSSPRAFQRPDARHRRRSSASLEVGPNGQNRVIPAKPGRDSRPRLQVRFNSQVELVEPTTKEWPEDSKAYYPQALKFLPTYFPSLPRLLLLVFVIALFLSNFNSKDNALAKLPIFPVGAHAGPVGTQTKDITTLQRRQTSVTSPCFRWAGEAAVVNGTFYYYGGRSSSQTAQSSDTWNNDFVTLDLTKSWEIQSPSISALAQPSGPPAVSLGYLWNSYDSLYLYGGEFEENPVTSPVPFSTWSYDIAAKSWQEGSSSPQNVAGTNAEANTPVQRIAEGAGVSVPNLGRGFYFGGHQDFLTTVGWSDQIAREYLTSLLEYTFPGYSNDEIEGDPTAGASGIYRNITRGGTQDTAGFPERADGVIVYVPGFGKQGIVLGLAAGTNSTFTQMNVIDVYDIASSSWYKQATSGPTPKIRVNPCAVAVSAADGSSTNVYMYGGQNLTPYKAQTQYDDMWILSLPSFTWVEVTYGAQESVPPGRSGHMCAVWNSQMVVWGGYIGPDYSCESPGIYVFNTSSLTWQNVYNALHTDDVLNRQPSQQHDLAALQGSFGYEVPAAVQKVVGGNAAGGATVTAPAQSALSGPLATGSPVTYSVSGASTITTTSNGHLITQTTQPTSLPPASNNGSSSSRSGSGTNVAAIAAGVVAGFFAVLAAYMAFCAWLYRKQLKLYKDHVAMSQRTQLAGDSRYIGAGLGGVYSDKTQSSSERPSGDTRGSSRHANGGTTRQASNNPYRNNSNGNGGTKTARSSTDDLMAGQEPSFLGVMLNPRRSLRVVNRD